MSTGNSSSTGATVGQKVKYVFVFSISTTTTHLDNLQGRIPSSPRYANTLLPIEQLTNRRRPG